jgi:hypothetical protein
VVAAAAVEAARAKGVVVADAVPVSSIEAARAKQVAVADAVPVSSIDMHTSTASTEMILQRLQEAAAKAANDHGE